MKGIRRWRLVLLGAAFALPAPARAVGWEADLSVENRVFAQAPRWDGQSPDHHNLSLGLETRYTHDWLGDALGFTGALFLRGDETDLERSHADLREFELRYRGEHFAVHAGILHEFWGVAESEHLVDIVNQSDLRENPDGEDKLGQPALSVSLVAGHGTLELFALPWFRERPFPGKEGRLRPFLPVDTDHPVYEDDARDRHVDFAARLAQSPGGWDLGLSWFHGTSRDPRLLYAVDGATVQGNPPPLCAISMLPQPLPGLLASISPDCESYFSLTPVNPHLVPAYDQIDQVGLEVQRVTNGWLLKFEGIHRDSRVEDYWASVAGVEYTLGTVLHSSVDLTLVLEYDYDDRGALRARSPEGVAVRKLITGEPFTVPEARGLLTLVPRTYSPFQDDFFVGTRVALNDEATTTALIGAYVDRRTGATITSIEGSRRLAGDWKVALESRAFLHIPRTDPLYSLEHDAYLQLEFIRYF